MNIMFHSMLNPSNRRRCYRCKDNYYFEVLQIGDLLLRRELDIKFKHSKIEITMKKNIIKAAFVAAFASIAGYGVYTSQQKVEISDLAKANVEALANKFIIL